MAALFASPSFSALSSLFTFSLLTCRGGGGDLCRGGEGEREDGLFGASPRPPTM